MTTLPTQSGKDKEYNNEYLAQSHWKLTDRSDKILEYFKKYVDPSDTILELGCSGGRNLIALRNAGYLNVTGMEMSDVAVKQLQENGIPVIHGRYEETPHGEYDVVFSASFLQEFWNFPHKELAETLSKTRKYFFIFGDSITTFEHEGFTRVEETKAEYPFSQPIIVLKNEKHN